MQSMLLLQSRDDTELCIASVYVRFDNCLLRAWEANPPVEAAMGERSGWDMALWELRAEVYWHAGVYLLKVAADKVRWCVLSLGS